MSLALNGVNFFFSSLLSFLYGALAWTILFLAYIVTFFAAINHSSFKPDTNLILLLVLFEYLCQRTSSTRIYLPTLMVVERLFIRARTRARWR